MSILVLFSRGFCKLSFVKSFWSCLFGYYYAFP